MQFEDGDVEGAAAEIVDSDYAVALFVETIGERSGGGFIDEAKDFESGDTSGIFSGLALRIIEIRGHSDDSLADRLAKVTLGIAFELAENERGDLRGCVGLVAELDSQCG